MKFNYKLGAAALSVLMFAGCPEANKKDDKKDTSKDAKAGDSGKPAPAAAQPI